MHLKRLDHSPAYWKLVAAVCPGYREARQWLRSNGPALRLGVGNRGKFLVVLGSAAGLAPIVGWLIQPSAAISGTFPIMHTEEEWRRTLSAAQFRVLRGQATERPLTSALYHEHRDGIFQCAGCARELFASNTKFESGTGWP